MGLQKQDLESDTLSTTTVQGRTDPERCFAIQGLEVTGLSQEGMLTMDMPRTYLHGSFENFNAEVPTRSEVLQMRGLEHLADRFMEDYTDLQPVMLIGRNCIWAQVQVQEISPDHQLLAAETQLGMCIMGQIPQYPPGPYRRQTERMRKNNRRRHNIRSRKKFRQQQAEQRRSGRQTPNQRFRQDRTGQGFSDRQVPNQGWRQRQTDQWRSSRQAPRMSTSQTRPLMDITFSNANF